MWIITYLNKKRKCGGVISVQKWPKSTPYNGRIFKENS
jgi:hypothetical protein